MSGYAVATTLVALGLMFFGFNKIADPDLRYGVEAVALGLIIYTNGRLADFRRKERDRLAVERLKRVEVAR